jgi:hypothetical protein
MALCRLEPPIPAPSLRRTRRWGSADPRSRRLLHCFERGEDQRAPLASFQAKPSRGQPRCIGNAANSRFSPYRGCRAHIPDWLRPTGRERRPVSVDQPVCDDHQYSYSFPHSECGAVSHSNPHADADPADSIALPNPGSSGGCGATAADRSWACLRRRVGKPSPVQRGARGWDVTGLCQLGLRRHLGLGWASLDSTPSGVAARPQLRQPGVRRKHPPNGPVRWWRGQLGPRTHRHLDMGWNGLDGTPTADLAAAPGASVCRL